MSKKHDVGTKSAQLWESRLIKQIYFNGSACLRGCLMKGSSIWEEISYISSKLWLEVETFMNNFHSKPFFKFDVVIKNPSHMIKMVKSATLSIYHGSCYFIINTVLLTKKKPIISSLVQIKAFSKVHDTWKYYSKIK